MRIVVPSLCASFRLWRKFRSPYPHSLTETLRGPSMMQSIRCTGRASGGHTNNGKGVTRQMNTYSDAIKLYRVVRWRILHHIPTHPHSHSHWKRHSSRESMRITRESRQTNSGGPTSRGDRETANGYSFSIIGDDMFYYHTDHSRHHRTNTISYIQTIEQVISIDTIHIIVRTNNTHISI